MGFDSLLLDVGKFEVEKTYFCNLKSKNEYKYKINLEVHAQEGSLKTKVVPTELSYYQSYKVNH